MRFSDMFRRCRNGNGSLSTDRGADDDDEDEAQAPCWALPHHGHSLLPLPTFTPCYFTLTPCPCYFHMRSLLSRQSRQRGFAPRLLSLRQRGLSRLFFIKIINKPAQRLAGFLDAALHCYKITCTVSICIPVFHLHVRRRRHQKRHVTKYLD